MAQHGSIDRANNAPIWVAAEVNKAPNSYNQANLYGNSTVSAYVTNQAVGVVGVAANEMATYTQGKPAHSGWHLRRMGTGNRQGRIHYECLVAGGFTTDSVDEGAIVISINPANKSINTHAATTFSIGAVAVPNAAITYAWYANTGAGMVALTDAGVYSNTATATLSISNTATLNAVSYSVRMESTGSVNVTSSNATLTVNAATITIGTQPVVNNVTAPAAATFSVVATVDPTAVTKTYQWQRWTGAAFADLGANAVYTNVTTASLVITNSTGLTGSIFRCRVMGIDAANVNSANVTFTVAP